MSDTDSASTFSVSLDHNDFIDPVSFETFDAHVHVPITLPCGHSITKTTYDKLTSHGENKCPVCRGPIPTEFAVQKNILLTNILAKKKRKKYYCKVHKNEKAKYICLDEKAVFCEECLLNDSHTAHNKRKLERHFDELEVQTKKFRTSVDNFGSLIISKRKSKEDHINKAITTLQEGLNSILTKNEENAIEKLREWRIKSYEVVQKYETVRQGHLDIDFEVSNCSAPLKDLERIEKEYEEDLGRTINRIVKKISTVVKEEYEGKMSFLEEDTNSANPKKFAIDNHDFKIIELHKDNDVHKLIENVSKKVVIICNNLTDKGVKSISQCLLDFNQLESLRIDFTRSTSITDKSIEQLASKIGKLPCLLELILEFSDCTELTDRTLKWLSAAVENQPFLTNLQLDFSDCTLLSDEGVYDLLAVLPELKSLTYFGLYLCSCRKVTDKSANHLAFNLQRMPKIMNLDISFNCTEVTSTGFSNLLLALKNFTSLVGLKLFFNKCIDVGDEQFRLLSTILEKNLQIRKLFLAFGGTEVTDTGLLTIASTILKLKELISFELYVWEMNITDRGALQLIQSLSTLANLEKVILDFASCDLVSDCVAEEIISLQACSNLNYLSLDFNETSIQPEKLEYLKSYFKEKIEFIVS